MAYIHAEFPAHYASPTAACVMVAVREFREAPLSRFHTFGLAPAEILRYADGTPPSASHQHNEPDASSADCHLRN